MAAANFTGSAATALAISADPLRGGAPIEVAEAVDECVSRMHGVSPPEVENGACPDVVVADERVAEVAEDAGPRMHVASPPEIENGPALGVVVDGAQVAVVADAVGP